MKGVRDDGVWRGAGALAALAAMALFVGLFHDHAGHEDHHVHRTPHHAAVSGCLGKDGVPHFHRVLAESFESCLACIAGGVPAPPPSPPLVGSVPVVGALGGELSPTWRKLLGPSPARPRAPPFAG